MNAFNRGMARFLILCMLAFGAPLPAFADIVTTDQIYASAERERVRGFLDRADVQARMQSMGVDPTLARARVDALTDAEAQQLAGHIDQLPAGADSFWGVLLAIFVILLITDILGLTKIFPFTRSMR
ncbi:MAG: PA2779 family protein [Betaproteobacteria bacterium]